MMSATRVRARVAAVGVAVVAAIAGPLVLLGTATAQEELSTACAKLNVAPFDALYTSSGFTLPFFAGDTMTMTAGPPTNDTNPEGVKLTVDDLVFTDTFPGTVTYTIPTDGSYTVQWTLTPDPFDVATWTVTCEPGLAPPTTTTVATTTTTIAPTTTTTVVAQELLPLTDGVNQDGSCENVTGEGITQTWEFLTDDLYGNPAELQTALLYADFDDGTSVSGITPLGTFETDEDGSGVYWHVETAPGAKVTSASMDVSGANADGANLVVAGCSRSGTAPTTTAAPTTTTTAAPVAAAAPAPAPPTSAAEAEAVELPHTE